MLAVNEAWIAYEKGESFLEVETEPLLFERRSVELGLSDGIWSEVTAGLDPSDRIKTGAMAPVASGSGR